MASSMQGRLYQLARRLSIGRVLRYLDFWGRYLWRRGISIVSSFRRSSPGGVAAAQAAALANADMITAKRMAVAS